MHPPYAKKEDEPDAHPLHTLIRTAADYSA